MRQIVKRINNIFVQIILFFFYFIVVGIGFALQKLAGFFRKSREKDTYWIKENIRYKTNYFESPY